MSEPAVHTCEHILNQTMVRMFGCPRSRNAHIERKKSKCDYILDSCPTEEQIASIEAKVNEVISADLPVTIEFMDRSGASAGKFSQQWNNISRSPNNCQLNRKLVSLQSYGRNNRINRDGISRISRLPAGRKA